MFGDQHWNDPVRWNKAADKAGKRRRVFCASMADVFEDHPSLDDPRERLWNLIEATPWLDWQLLTKRPENIVTMVPADWLGHNRRPNVWLGTTVENQKYAELRLPHLLVVPAAVHFVSYEPALGPIDLLPWMDHECGAPPHYSCPNEIGWVIAGGESGPGHRAPDLEWFRKVRNDCKLAGVPFFFKQVGGIRPTSGGDMLDGVVQKQFPLGFLADDEMA